MGNGLEVAFVSKPLPVFKSILDNHEELNYYLKKVILEHREILGQNKILFLAMLQNKKIIRSARQRY